MILDERLEFADSNTGVQASAGTVLIGDVIDLGATPQDYGNGQPMYLVIQVDTAIDSAMDGATVSFTLASDAGSSIATDGTATEHIITDVIAEADLVAGYTICQPLPVGNAGVLEYERYLGVLATVAGETVTAGAVSAFLTFDPTGWKSYPDATN